MLPPPICAPLSLRIEPDAQDDWGCVSVITVRSAKILRKCIAIGSKHWRLEARAQTVCLRMLCDVFFPLFNFEDVITDEICLFVTNQPSQFTLPSLPYQSGTKVSDVKNISQRPCHTRNYRPCVTARPLHIRGVNLLREGRTPCCHIWFAQATPVLIAPISVFRSPFTN